MNVQGQFSEYLINPACWESVAAVRTAYLKTGSMPLAQELFNRYMTTSAIHWLKSRFIDQFCFAPELYPVMLCYPQATKDCVSQVLSSDLPYFTHGFAWSLIERGAVLQPGATPHYADAIKRIAKHHAAVKRCMIALYGAMRKRRGLDRHVASIIAQLAWKRRRVWHKKQTLNVKRLK